MGQWLADTSASVQLSTLDHCNSPRELLSPDNTNKPYRKCNANRSFEFVSRPSACLPVWCLMAHQHTIMVSWYYSAVQW